MNNKSSSDNNRDNHIDDDNVEFQMRFFPNFTVVEILFPLELKALLSLIWVVAVAEIVTWQQLW